MPGIVAPPFVNLPVATQSAIAALQAAQASCETLIASADAAVDANPLPVSGTDPALAAEAVVALMNGLLGGANLRALDARLQRMIYNLQVM